MNDQIQELEENIFNDCKRIDNLTNSLQNKEYEKNDVLKKFALGIIDVIDSLQRILEKFKEKNLFDSEENYKIINHYKDIEKKLFQLLNNYGITKLEFSENKLITGYCEVMDIENDMNRKNYEIASIVREGYIRGKELIRTAQVIIIKN